MMEQPEISPSVPISLQMPQSFEDSNGDDTDCMVVEIVNGPDANKRSRETAEGNDLEASGAPQENLPSPKRRRVSLTKEEKQARQQAKLAEKQKKEEEKRRKEEEKKRKEEEKREEKRKKEEEKKKKEEEKKRKEEEKKKKEEEKEAARLKKEEEKKKKEEEKEAKRLKKEEEERKKKEAQELEARKAQELNQKLMQMWQKVSKPKEEVSPSDKENKIGGVGESRFSVEEIDEMIARGQDSVVLMKEFIERQKKSRVTLTEAQKLRRSTSHKKSKYIYLEGYQKLAGPVEKESNLITGRKPYYQDKSLINYEVESEDEGEEEPEGESTSDNEKEEENEEGLSEEEEGWIVPDGYISEDEGIKDEAAADGSKSEENNEDKQLKKRRQLKELAQKQMSESAAKAKPLNTICLGLYFGTNHEYFASFKPFGVRIFHATPINPWEEIEVGTPKKQPKPFPEDVLPELIQLVHSNAKAIQKLVDEFHTNHQSVSKLQLERKIREIAAREQRSGYIKKCWFVRPEVFKNLGMAEPPLKNVPSITSYLTSPSKAVNSPSESTKLVSPENNGTAKQTTRVTPITHFFRQTSAIPEEYFDKKESDLSAEPDLPLEDINKTSTEPTAIPVQIL